MKLLELLCLRIDHDPCALEGQDAQQWLGVWWAEDDPPDGLYAEAGRGEWI